ncbi:hypothetical protein FAB82_03080 [Glycomyces buryatensis]|uniref:Uncharacterized protein n=2 Tax=Glycomyces buryatensis TaxID=2570927 RepID=A0A4S8QFA1_9ACTN|nr:hypothetical protein FAB82_03080 [Glycomyces buryatensis]
MRWMRAWIVSGFVLAAVAAALAGGLLGGRDGADRSGEADQADQAEAAPSAVPDLTATAEIRRSFSEPGVVSIAVTNHGDAPVRVLGVDLVSESFAPLGIQETDANVPPSVNPRDLMIDYGEARCPDGLDSTTAPSQVVLDVETEDGAPHRVTAPLPHPNGTLDRLLREACGAALVAASVSVELGELQEEPDGTLAADLTVTPGPGVDVAADEVRGSVLFEVVAADLSGPVVRVGFDAHRCEGHAVGDAKQPFAFKIWLSIDGSDPLPAPIPVSDEQRQRLLDMLDSRCGHAGD